MKQHLLCLCLIVLGHLTCNINDLQAQKNQKSILFIGNSYTYVNDLPNLLKSIANEKGDSILVDSYTPGGSAFQGHASNPAVLEKINSRKWDFVILQDQSQRPAFPDAQIEKEVFPYAQKLCEQIRANDSCTTIAFYMTWGRKYGDKDNCAFFPPICTYLGMQERLSMAYRKMAKENKAIVIPVGMAWKESIQQDSLYNLYDADNSHPNINGSYLSACTFYSTLFQKKTSGIQFKSSLSDSQATRLQTIADKIALDSLFEWRKNLEIPKSLFDVNQLPKTYTVAFKSNSEYAKRLQWFVGDSMVSNRENFEIDFKKPQTIYIRLVVDNGCLYDTLKDTLEIRQLVGRDMLLQDNPFNIAYDTQSQDLKIFNHLSESQEVRIYNSLNQLIKNYPINANQNLRIATDALPSGIYYITIINSNIPKSNTANYSYKWLKY